MVSCSIDGCNRPHYGRSWCRMHYKRWQRHGDPLVLVNVFLPDGPAKQARRAELMKAYRAKYVTRGRVLVRTAKAGPCMDCGIKWPYYVMHFDHVRGVKLFNIAHWQRLGKNAEEIEAEIAKCDVVCANCHAIRTHERAAATRMEA